VTDTCAACDAPATGKAWWGESPKGHGWNPSCGEHGEMFFSEHDTLPKGAEWFPDEGGIQWQGQIYYPADYVLTRKDIADLRAKAWDEGYIASEDYRNDYDRVGLDAVGSGNPYRNREVGGQK
jgi:hypothetical protein